MREIDFTQKASVGQYLPGSSALHGLTPQVKLFSVILILAGLLLTSPVMGSLSGILLLHLLCALSHTPVKFIFRNIKPIIPFLILLSLMRVFFTYAPNSPVLTTWASHQITLAGLLSSLGIIFRFFAILGLLTLFTAVTPSREIGHGAERLTAPLAKLGFPSQAFSMVLTITFRFIPILTTEAENLIKVQASRGAPIGMSRNPFKKMASYLPILIPLFVASLERSEQLAQAMEARCYEGGTKRTHYMGYTIHKKDGGAMVISLISFALLTALRFTEWETVIVTKLL